MLNTINICKIHFALSILKRQNKYNLGVLKICSSLQHCFTWSSFCHYMDFIVILYGSLSAVPLIMSMTKRRPHSIDPHCVAKERNYVMCPPLCIERNAENLSLIQHLRRVVSHWVLKFWQANKHKESLKVYHLLHSIPFWSHKRNNDK